jgi:hypothetical protein
MFLKNYIISVEVDMVLQQHENYTIMCVSFIGELINKWHDIICTRRGS